MIPEGEKVKIGVTIKTFDDVFMSYVLKAIEARIQNEPQIEVVYGNGNNDVATQLKVVEDFITVGCDVVIVHCVDNASCEAIVEQCSSNDIPVLGLTTPMSDIKGLAGFSGSDVYEQGTMAAQGLISEYGEEAKIAIITGTLGRDATIQRTTAFKEGIADYEGLEVVVEAPADWNREPAMELVENWLQAGMEFDVIYANNDEMAIGAALAIQGQGLDLDDYFIIGTGADPTAIKEWDLIDMSVFQNAVAHGDNVITLAIQALYDPDFEMGTNMYAPNDIITDENIEWCTSQWESVFNITIEGVA